MIQYLSSSIIGSKFIDFIREQILLTNELIKELISQCNFDH